MKRCVLICAFLFAIAAGLFAQAPQEDVLGIHNLGPGGPGPVSGPLPACQFCHAPHSGVQNSSLPATPLWSQKLSTESNYTLYTSSTLVNQEMEPTLGSASNLCLSCHDGTVAPGTNVPYTGLQMAGTMNSQDLFIGTLQGIHPFNFKLPLNCSNDNLLTSLCSGTTGNPAVQLISGNVQCNSCHNPHVQGIDPVAQNFLVMNNANSAMCLACHVSQPSDITAVRTPVSNAAAAVASGSTSAVHPSASHFSAFASWKESIHATAIHKLNKGAKAGPYTSVNQNACLSCHTSHNAPGGPDLLSGPVPPVPNMDAATQDCIGCHNGGANLSPAIPNVFAEFSKAGHPFPVGNNRHATDESVVLKNNRHATCVDCHNPHATRPTLSFASTAIRESENGTLGVSATDGVTEVNPALDQYEICLRCHGTSTGKQTLAIFGYAPVRTEIGGDPLNLIPQFGATARSSHPVMHDNKSALPQPSLLKFMWNLDGHTQGRQIINRILCTDCHNSDDNREFGGTGPNGPHGSQFPHILERRYEFSQVAQGLPPMGGPGSTITNLLPAITDPGAGGPYSLCAKCHDLNNILANASFSKHALHINAGFSCSACHTAHGMGANSSNVTGERLVNFDLKVVAENAGTGSSTLFRAPISYNRATSTCTLTCHNYNHNSDGTVTAVKPAPPAPGVRKN
ncbi:MAG TPA: cytochrome c3 family protein [Candidatus Binatia bacterium]|nr:cytochrome c3 family protein [Candidatus Binatia bacterium]